MTTQYLYTPPTWRNPSQIAGSLIVGVPTSTCVYRKSGVWTNVLTPGLGEVEGCDVLNGQLLMFDRPTVVPASLYAELSALQPADPSWTPGTLTPL